MPIHLVIHGHFYQPPRENPWTGEIERQASAAPFHDWNARIVAECYEPNARSRVLDEHGRIRDIVNNYERISFNVGPTLRSWLNEAAPDVVAALPEGDRASQRRLGHGNAVAQAYNHMILPLATRRDRQTQIRWGIREFEVRFGRRPEAMWMPETAVDAQSMELLVQAGMCYVILSPAQALRWRPVGESRWISAGHTAGSCAMPRAARRATTGSMSAFITRRCPGGSAFSTTCGTPAPWPAASPRRRRAARRSP
mgnify:CR=1 FL=1